MISIDGMVAKGFGGRMTSGFVGTMVRAIDLLLELRSLELLLRWWPLEEEESFATGWRLRRWKVISLGAGRGLVL
jgi:hypothetical protein